MRNIKIDQTLYTTRPDTPRLKKEERVYDLFEKLGIEFVRVDHEAITSIEGNAGIESLLGIEICKNLFLTNSKKDKYFLLTMPGKKNLVTSELSKSIGSTRLSFGHAEKMSEYLSLTPGSVTPLGLMNDVNLNVQFLIDRELLDREFIGCHPCMNTSSLKIRVDDIINKFLPAVKHVPHFVEI